jgi:predicted nucleic-acid-binding Zn-ribbon protein
VLCATRPGVERYFAGVAEESPYLALERLLETWQKEKALPDDEDKSPELDAQTTAAIHWLKSKWGEDKPCPWCGNDTYYVSPPEPLALAEGGQTAPYISVICRNCGQTTRIDLRIFQPGQSVGNDIGESNDP